MIRIYRILLLRTPDSEPEWVEVAAPTDPQARRRALHEAEVAGYPDAIIRHCMMDRVFEWSVVS